MEEWRSSVNRLRFCSSKGVTLIEALLSLFLVLIVLGLSGGLIRDYSQSLRNSTTGDRWLEAALVGAAKMGQEASQAILFTRPAAGSLVSDSELRFTRLDPSDVDVRFPSPLPDPLPATWNVADPAHALEVRYYLNAQERLVREV